MVSIRIALVLVAVASFAAVGAPADDRKENKLPENAKAILDKAEQFELFSLDPAADRGKAKDGFHGFKVLGKTALKDAKVRKQVVDSLYDGIAKSNGNGAKCFDPRHGIRATIDGKTVDLVICFECGWVYIFFDDDEQRQAVVVSTGAPQPTFDKVLKDAGVPLPKQAGK